MPVENRSTVPGAVLTGIGVILTLVAIIWASIIGFYPEQLPVILILVALGVGSGWYGQRIYQAAKRENAIRSIRRRDAGEA